jgi:hypothetical protein
MRLQFLDESIEKFMDYSHEVFWMSQTLSVNPIGITKETSQYLDWVVRMHHEGEKKESVCSFVCVLVFVYVDSTSFEHSSSIYMV